MRAPLDLAKSLLGVAGAVEVAAAVEAAEVAAGVEAAAGVEVFGSTGAAAAAWRVQDAQ